MKNNDSTRSFSILPEIMNITFKEIVNELIDMIIDQIDSTHLLETLPNTSSSSNADTLVHLLSFDAYVAVQQAQVAIRKDPCIKQIKAIKYKREYLKIDDIKQGSSIKNYEELLAFIELFIHQFEHFSSINFCFTEQVPSIIVKFCKHEDLIKAANFFKNGKEFKIINIPINIDLDIVEKAIRNLLRGDTFYLRYPSKHYVDQKLQCRDIFFTAFSSSTCNNLKQTWSISIDSDVFHLIPAYFKKSDIEARNKYVGKFSGFSPYHTLAYIKDNLQDITNLKNVYRR
ncbi:hypothetical protein C1645_812952 [Glomus cerebriforme]|uniref:Uncharacterized protein n=1 Tax=Glomus cerebriforme TaxID=658196 RepID=A0A397TP35_9GLOM|nr:hypothetical protein C1645_812952 [Glomus cerebriforme]